MAVGERCCRWYWHHFDSGSDTPAPSIRPADLAIGTVIAVSGFLEMGMIVLQVVRGQASHVDIGTTTAFGLLVAMVAGGTGRALLRVRRT